MMNRFGQMGIQPQISAYSAMNPDFYLKTMRRQWNPLMYNPMFTAFGGQPVQQQQQQQQKPQAMSWGEDPMKMATEPGGFAWLFSALGGQGNK